MPLTFQKGLGDLMQGGKGLPPPPGTAGFRNPIPPPPKFPPGLSKLLKFGGVAIGVVADFFLNAQPVSDGTIPPWITDVGEQQTLSEAVYPFTGGQASGVSYKLKIEYGVRSLFNPNDPYQQRIYQTGKIYTGPITEATVTIGGDGDTLVWTVTAANNSTTTYFAKPAGTSAYIDPNSPKPIFVRVDGQPDTSGNPPPTQAGITTSKTWDASRALLDTLSAPEWQFADEFTKLPDFALPKGGIGFAPLGQTAEQVLGKTINSNPQPNLSTSTGTGTTTAPPPPTTAPDAKPGGIDNKQGLLPPPPVVPPPTKTVNNNPTPKPGTKTTKYPEPNQTKVDKCAGSCATRGGGGETSFNPGSTAANNLALLFNDLLLQNPLLKKIDATTTGTNGFVKKAWKTTRLSKILEYLTLAVTLHNAAMLSRNLGASLGDAISAIANNTISLIKNEEDQSIDINETLGNSIEGFLINLLGASNYQNLTETFSKYNRIVNSAANITYSILSIQAGLAEGLETIGNYTGRIGNALKKSGAVLENSYSWMSEKVSVKTGRLGQIQAILDAGEGVENFASEIQNATSEFREAQENVNQIGEQINKVKTEFTNSETEKTDAETITKTNSQATQPELTDFVRDSI